MELYLQSYLTLMIFNNWKKKKIGPEFYAKRIFLGWREINKIENQTYQKKKKMESKNGRYV